MSEAMEPVADLSAFVMMADGREDPEEWAALKPLAEHQGFAWDDFSKAVEASLKEQAEAESTEITEGIIHGSGYGLNVEKVEVLFEDLIDVVLSNDKIDLGEIEVMVKVREILRISETYFVTILAMKISEHVKDGKLRVTFNDLDKSTKEILEEIKAETKEELEEVA
jgi:uncharacterized tellurite resistance protein B-like protein